PVDSIPMNRNGARPARRSPRGKTQESAHDATDVLNRGGGAVAGLPVVVGQRSGPGLWPGVGRAIWPHRLGTVLPLSLRLVSAKLLGQRILPLQRRPLLPLSARNARARL